MGSFGLSTIAPSNVKSSGIASVSTDWSTYSEVLTALSGGTVTETTQQGLNEKGMEKAHGFIVEAKVDFDLMDGTNIALIPTLLSGFHTTGITLINGDHLQLGNSTVGHNGVPKCKLSISEGTAKHRTLEMMFKRYGVIDSATSSVFDRDILHSTYSAASGSVLFTGNTYRTSGGLKTFSLRNTGETNYESVRQIQNITLTADFLCDDDDEGRYFSSNTVNIHYSVDVMDMTSATIGAGITAILKAVSTDHKFGLIDAVVMTCNDNLGITTVTKLDGGSSKSGLVTFSGSGNIPLSSFAALFS